MRKGAGVELWRSPAEIPADLARTVVTIGVFDGVHRGHQAVIRQAAALAKDRGLPLVALTFDPHPMVVLRPEQAPATLIGVDQRARLLNAAGADAVLVLPFSRERSHQSPENFVEELLVGELHVAVVVVGRDFRFGHRAAGDVDLLRELGAKLDFEVVALELVGDGAQRWSSTRARERLLAGDVTAAAEVLGRPFRVEGIVVEGDHRGREMGYPTANIPVRPGEIVPADGVYAGWLARLDHEEEDRLPAAISVGTNPTFDGSQRRVEAYVLDRDDLELYGVPVAIEFVERLRGMERFESVADLLSQMADDIDRTRTILAG